MLPKIIEKGRRFPPNPFGVLDFLTWDHDWNDHHYPIESVRKSVNLMRQAGIGMVRMDFLWSDVEPQPGHFNFRRYDSIVQLLGEAHIDILGLLHYNPGWRSGPWNAAPVIKDFGAYALKTVRHFRGSVRDWEIWNEPDHAVYWMPQDGMKAYSALLKSVYSLIKNEDPHSRIILGGLSQAVPDNLRRVYAIAGRESFDVVNIHPFVSPLKKDAAAELRRQYEATMSVMREFKDESKPMWITEVGCPGVPESMHTPAWWLGQNPTEKEQAEWVRTIYLTALEWQGIEKIFWAFFRDTSRHFKNGADYFGLVRNDFTLKPAYSEYQSFAKRRPPFEAQKILS